ncbi:hypothetical protein AB0Y38_08385 [Lysinibacillus capsici]|uniref:hypothetical protein n=1 Tax=Lysinibacillus capsici TaxID=2115968 RepID=UPI003F297787
MKKFRGKRRYFRNLWRQITTELSIVDFDEEGWFNLWHTHLDFYGCGNNGLKIRREHIKAHIVLYNRLLERLSTFGKPYQIWMEFVEEDAGLDSVNIHTPNPAEDNFPLTIANVDWNCPVPKFLKDLIDLNEWNVGYYKQVSTNSYFIQSNYNEIKL